MKKLIKYIPGVMLLVIAFTGCLKTNPLYEGFEDIKPLADINLSNLSDANDSATAYALDLLKDPNGTIDTAIAVHLSSSKHVGDVTFKMARVDDDPTFQAFFKHNQLMFNIWNNATQDEWDALDEDTQNEISDYVDKHDELTLLPENLYTIDNWDVTIKDAGLLNVGRLKMKVKTGVVDNTGTPVFATHNYVIPIAIQDAGGYEIASNFRMIFLELKGKNAYDGKYHYTSSATTSVKPNQDVTISVVTAGLNRVKVDLLGYYSGNPVWYNIDPVTNKITVECPSLGVDSPQDPRSMYDPATRTMHVYWKSGSYKFEETLVYSGPR